MQKYVSMFASHEHEVYVYPDALAIPTPKDSRCM